MPAKCCFCSRPVQLLSLLNTTRAGQTLSHLPVIPPNPALVCDTGPLGLTVTTASIFPVPSGVVRIRGILTPYKKSIWGNVSPRAAAKLSVFGYCCRSTTERGWGVTPRSKWFYLQLATELRLARTADPLCPEAAGSGCLPADSFGLDNKAIIPIISTHLRRVLITIAHRLEG